MINQPKWGHLKELHAAIKLCSATLLSGVPTKLSLGQEQLARIFAKSTRMNNSFSVLIIF